MMVCDEVRNGRRMGNGPLKAAGMAAAVAAMLLLCASGALGAWIPPQLVSTGGSTNNFIPRIATDPSENPCVVWNGYDGSNQQIYYARNAGSGWTPEKVSTGTSTGNNDPRIAIDSSGNPSVVWNATDGGGVSQIYYARNTGSGWTPEKVSTGASTINQYQQIRLDSSGNPCVVWSGFDGSSWQVYYAKNTGSGWTPQKVSTGAPTGNLNPQLALDSSDNPCVVWWAYDGSNYPVYYAKNTGSGWTPEKVSTGASTSNQYPQIALDSSGNPNVVWFGTSGSVQVFYAENTGSGWTPQLVSTGTSTANQGQQIVLDSSGNPNVVWYGYVDSSYQAYYAENTGSGWTPQLVSTGTSNSNQNPQIALDPSGNPNVVWYGHDGSAYQAYYAENTGSGWTPQLVSTGTSTDNFSTQISLDSFGSPQVTWNGSDGSISQVYFSGLAGDLAVTTEPATSITQTTVTLHGDITDTGGGNVLERGFFYRKTSDSEWSGWSEVGSFGTGTYSKAFAGLSPQTDYECVAFARNSTETVFATPVGFTTLASVAPTVESGPAAVVLGTSAWLNGNITDTGGENPGIRGFQYRIQGYTSWSIIAEGGDFGTGGFWLPVDELEPATTYEYRALAYNTAGEGYAPNILTFRTLDYASVATGAASSVSSEQATLNGSITDLAGPNADQRGFRYRRTGTGDWTQWTEDGDFGTGPFSHAASSLVPGTTYEFQAMAHDTAGWAYGATLTFQTEAGPPSALSTWYLAEGSTAWGFETYISVVNPNSSAATVRLTYMPAGEPNVTQTMAMRPDSRATIYPRDLLGAVDFSTKVECLEGLPIAVDRTMEWMGGGSSGAGASALECHSSIGVTAPAKTWYMPEGSTNWGFETWLVIQNPNDTKAECKVTYMIEGEGPKTVDHEVGANSRASFSMMTDIGSKDASIKVESDLPVIGERAMYRNDRRAGSDSIGTTAPSDTFYLAEGTTAWGYTTYLLIQNPNDSEARVTVVYMAPDGDHPQAPFTMGANSRRTIRVNDAAPDMDVSIRVQGSKPIIAERSMYWDNGTGEACHDSIGLDAPHTAFYLPDGQAGSDVETWTLVQNPNTADVKVSITYLAENGEAPKVIEDTIPANSRRSYNMADAGISGRHAIVVTSRTAGKKIMAERSMYWNSRGAGTSTIGGFSDTTD